MPQTWYILRHGDKERGDFYNPQLKIHDHPISAKGRQQAERLRDYFSGKPIEAIYISAYQRTRQSIEPVAQQLNLSPILDPRLNEINNGRIGVMTDPEVQQAFPDVWDALIHRSADFRFPEGETGQEAQRRIVSFMEEKRQQHAGDLILDTHDGLIRLLMCHLMEIPVYKRWNFQVDTCGLTEIRYQEQFNSWKLIRFNQVFD